MRSAFVDALCEQAAADGRIFLLTADLGWSVLEKFAAAFPRRFLNVGVAEQNMLGIAAGLALEGHTPFVYSIATFASMRGYEQFRNGAVLHRLPVRVVGMGGGFSYGHAGPTHHALEDLAITRAQPGVAVIAPADSAQARQALRAAARVPGPVYFRIDKAELPDIPALDGRFALDRPELVRPGKDVLYLATGSITHAALKAAERLQRDGISAAVAVQAHLSFRASPALCHLLEAYPRVVTVEEGTTAGGLGSLTAEAIAQHGLPCRLSMQGVKGSFVKEGGGTEYLRGRHGIDAAGLAAVAEQWLRQREAA
jgi:transketolase